MEPTFKVDTIRFNEMEPTFKVDTIRVVMSMEARYRDFEPFYSFFSIVAFVVPVEIPPSTSRV